MPICFFIRYKNLMQICSVKGIYLHVCMHVCMYVYLLFNILLSKSLNHYSFGYIYMMSEFIIFLYTLGTLGNCLEKKYWYNQQPFFS